VPNPPLLDIQQIAQSVIYDAANHRIGTTKELADRLCDAPELRARVDAVLVPGIVAKVKVEHRFDDGCYILTNLSEKWPIASMHIAAGFRKETASLPLSHAAYGDTAVAHGQGKIFGKSLKVVTTQRPGDKWLNVALEIENTAHIEETQSIKSGGKDV
jgi:hypothetical protein